jgi:hypothetical protein
MSSKFICIVTIDGIILFSSPSVCYPIVYLFRIFFISSSTDSHFTFFHILASVKNAAMNLGLYTYHQHVDRAPFR